MGLAKFIYFGLCGIFMNLNKHLMIIALLLVISLSACAKKLEAQNDNAQIANPASTYCIEQGGKLEIRENPEGQYGVCILPDGTECEEWAYYRKECSVKQSEEACREENYQCCKGSGENISCIRAEVECAVGYAQEFLGCDLEKCMPRWNCVPMER